MSNFNSKFSEKYSPYILPLLLLIFYSIYVISSDTNIFIIKFNDLINISFTLASISLGFIATMIGCMMSITSSDVLKVLYSKKADIDLINYIKHAAILNFILLVLSIFLIFFDIPNNKLLYTYNLHILVYCWIYLFFVCILCSHRVIILLFSLLNSIIKSEKNKYLETNRHKPSQFKKPNE